MDTFACAAVSFLKVVSKRGLVYDSIDFLRCPLCGADVRIQISEWLGRKIMAVHGA